MKLVHFLITVGLVVVTVVGIGLSSTAIAADEENTISSNVPSGQFAALDSPDTLRTNFWLTEALMAEIVRSTVQVLPPSPARILMLPATVSVQDELFHIVASGILMELGYELYVDTPDTIETGPVDVHYSFGVGSVELLYPETHRTLGLWKRWIARELNVTVNVKISLEETGQLLLSQRVVRRFNDRVEADDLDAVDSPLYTFTTADISESGWHSRIEEIVVLGTLAGLIAIYFSNTGN